MDAVIRAPERPRLAEVLQVVTGLPREVCAFYLGVAKVRVDLEGRLEFLTPGAPRWEAVDASHYPPGALGTGWNTRDAWRALLHAKLLDGPFGDTPPEPVLARTRWYGRMCPRCLARGATASYGPQGRGRAEAPCSRCGGFGWLLGVSPPTPNSVVSLASAGPGLCAVEADAKREAACLRSGRRDESEAGLMVVWLTVPPGEPPPGLIQTPGMQSLWDRGVGITHVARSFLWLVTPEIGS